MEVKAVQDQIVRANELNAEQSVAPVAVFTDIAFPRQYDALPGLDARGNTEFDLFRAADANGFFRAGECLG